MSNKNNEVLEQQKSEEVNETITQDMKESEGEETSKNETKDEGKEYSQEPGDITEESEAEEVTVKDYLDDSLFNDVKEVPFEQIFSGEDSGEVVPPDVLKLYEDTLAEFGEERIIKGRVIGHNEKEIIMDIGFKSEGIISREEFTGGKIPSIGDVIEVYLEKVEDKSGQTVLSKEKADWTREWNKIVEKYEKGETITGTISRRIKGGMVVEIGMIQGFLPGSQIDVHPVRDFDQYVGEEMEFRIVKVNMLRKNIVLSRKALLEDSIREQRDALLKEIEVGQVVEGRVKNVTDFGVFIDLGGVDGLLHVTDLSWGRINHPSEMVSVGDSIKVKVIGFDEGKKRISLGMKQLTPHPWDNVPEKYPVDTKIKGKVVSMTNYGAFIEIEKGVEGLVHVSEMSWVKNIHHPSEMVSLGDVVEAVVLSVNYEERKIALGFKQLEPDPWDGIEKKYPVDSVHKGIVRNLTQFGAFLELEEGVDGLIHVSDLSWTKVIRHPKEVVDKNQEVEVKILDVSRKSRRISLGLKQVSEDPWEEISNYYKREKQVEGKVIRVLDKGVILDLEMGVEGIIPSRMFSSTEKEKMLKQYRIGETTKGEVTDVRRGDKKIILKPIEEPIDEEKTEVQKEESKKSQDVDITDEKRDSKETKGSE